jgi:hypothetical protein
MANVFFPDGALDDDFRRTSELLLPGSGCGAEDPFVQRTCAP